MTAASSADYVNPGDGASCPQAPVTAHYRSKWPISHYGTCDGCAEQQPLVWAYDVDDHNEPWLCASCAKEQP